MQHRASITTFLCALAGLASAASAGAVPVVISDGTFVNANWTTIPRIYGPSGGSGSGTQVLSGGFADNGAARFTSNTAGPSNSGSYNAHIYTAFTYAPAFSGQLSSLSIAFDARYINGLSAIGAVVEQGSLVWFTGNQINTPSWQRYTFTPGSADWFLINPSGGVAGPGPDFSATGSPMRFGFFTANGSTGAGYTNSGLNDNFEVRFIPAPGVAALLGIASCRAARRRRA
jgi:hypothetical protein